MVTTLNDDRALAIRTLMPRAGAIAYDHLTRSGRAEVDRLVAAFAQIRADTLQHVSLEATR